MERYSRQEVLREIGKNGQKKLQKSSAAVIGIGALGTVTASFLARAGVGKLLLIDRDIVEIHNLQRQFIFTESDLNKPKAEQAMNYLKKVNSKIKIGADTGELNSKTINKLKNYEIILDCTDNMETRFLINDFCVKYKIPWIYAGAVQTKGRVLTITPKTPCFRCIFTPPKPGSLETCDTAGVLNTITAGIAAIQATEAVKLLTKQPYTKELILYDIWRNNLERIKTKTNKDCICCQKKQFSFLNSASITTKLCGQGRIQIKGKKPDMIKLTKKLKKLGKISKSYYGIYFTNKQISFFLFKDGRCLINAKTEEQANNFYSRYVGN
ncbi:NAD(P)H-binding protein [Candidatus Woesearchaeota archaeon CG10_big_fil_rev_8_21_14_0_10_34_8]|nr:MAG: NAD(P)H-binding protein [Candidatus Woesearchaeota archaeon CG10_big_fil_rev_8_21_14_0_10_34_8]